MKNKHLVSAFYSINKYITSFYLVQAWNEADMVSSILKGLVTNYGKLGCQLWHRPLKMASLVYEREIGGDDPGGGAFALFLRPHPGAFRQLMCPHPREFAQFFEKIANAGG